MSLSAFAVKANPLTLSPRLKLSECIGGEAPTLLGAFGLRMCLTEVDHVHVLYNRSRVLNSRRTPHSCGAREWMGGLLLNGNAVFTSRALRSLGPCSSGRPAWRGGTTPSVFRAVEMLLLVLLVLLVVTPTARPAAIRAPHAGVGRSRRKR